MPVMLSLADETTAGVRSPAGTLSFESSVTTLREIIRLRVRQEVERFNSAQPEPFRGLVQPEDSERILNPVRERRVVDWEKQFEKAVGAFRTNGLVALVDGRQIVDLDEPIALTPQTGITFLKLLPLVGG